MRRIFLLITAFFILSSCFNHKALTTELTNFTVNDDAIFADIRYPTVFCGGLRANDMNTKLRNAAFVLVANSFFSSEDITLANLNANSLLNSERWTAEVDYTCLLNDNFLSYHFYGSCSDGFRVWQCQSLCTMNKETGNFVSLSEIADITAISDLIINGEFDVVEGDYQPGGWDIDNRAFRLQLNDAFLEAEAQNQFREGLLNIASAKNFGFDGNNLYIRFYFYDSLNEFAILRLSYLQVAK